MEIFPPLTEMIDVVECFPADVRLEDVVDFLKDGLPVVVDDAGRWRLLLPSRALGMPSQRKLSELPLQDVPIIDATASAIDAESVLRRNDASFCLVMKGAQPGGIISREKLLSSMVKEIQDKVSFTFPCHEILTESRSLIWKIHLRHESGNYHLADVELHGPVKDILGYSPGDFKRKPDLWYSRRHPRDLPEWNSMLTELGEAPGMRFLEYRFLDSKGRWLLLCDHVRTKRDTDRNSIVLYGVTNDVTEELKIREMRRLRNRVHSTLARGDPGKTLEAVFEVLAEGIPIDEMLVWVIRPEEVTAVLQWSRPGSVYKTRAVVTELDRVFSTARDGDGGQSEWSRHFLGTVRTTKSVYHPDLSRNSDPASRVMVAHGFLSTLLVPLVVEDNEQVLLGVMCRRVDALSGEERQLLEELGPTFGYVVRAWRYENELKKLAARLEQRVRQRTYQLEVLYELAQELGYILSYDELLNILVRHLHRIVAYDITATALEVDETLHIAFYSYRPIDPDLSMHIREQLVRAFEVMGDQPISRLKIVVRGEETAAFSSHDTSVKALGSSFIVPIIIETELRTVGFLFVGAEKRNAFREDELRYLYAVANQASISIQKRREILANQKRQIERIMENLPEGVLLVDEEMNILTANPKAKAMLKLLGQKNESRKIEHLGGVPVNDLIELPPANKQWHTVIVKEPERRIFEISTLSMEERPKEKRWIFVLRDATREYEIMERIQQQEVLASVGQLAAGIAHDFNNILTVIIGTAELLEFFDDLQGEVKEHIRDIRAQGMRAARLIQQILDFSRKSVVERMNVQLIPLLKESVKLLRRTFPENIEIKLEINTDEAVVYSNPTQLQQIITNLAVNARDAMPAGGTLNIALSMQYFDDAGSLPFPSMRPGKWLILTVADTGSGIGPDLLPRIFDPFFTTKEVGKGTGLGLSQVYGIIKQNDGFIDVQSRVGQGSRFLVYLPAVEENEEEEILPTLDQQIYHREGQTILLVEDEELVLAVTKSMLSRLGYNVVTASDGSEALQLLEEKGDEITLVLTDMVMPRVGGRQLAEKIKSVLPEVKVVAMSGYPLRTETSTKQTKLFDGWIHKPPTLQSLSTVLQEVMEEKSPS